MAILTTTLLFVLTAVVEILGCYLPYLWLRHGNSPWLLLPAALSLAVFAWLLYVASHGGRAHLRRLWRGVHHCCAVMAVAGGWHQARAS